MLREEKGQAAIEYILLVAGALILVVLVVVLIKQYIFTPSASKAKNDTGEFFKLVSDFKKDEN